MSLVIGIDRKCNFKTVRKSSGTKQARRAVIQTNLEKHFSPKPMKIAERLYFYNHRQQSRETVADYLAELRKLAIHCKFGDFLEDALCDR